MLRLIGFIMVISALIVLVYIQIKNYQKMRMTAHIERVERREYNSLKLRFRIWQFETDYLTRNIIKYKPNAKITCKNPLYQEVFVAGITGNRQKGEMKNGQFCNC